MTIALVGLVATQSSTDASLATAFDTLIASITAVARSTAYTTASAWKLGPTTQYSAFMYRCTTNGTTASTAPAYSTTVGGITTDGTAVFTTMRAVTVTPSSNYLRCCTLDQIQLVVTGSLTITVGLEMLLMTNSPLNEIKGNSGGSILIRGKFTNPAGGNAYNMETAIQCTRLGVSTFDANDASIRMLSGSTFDAQGGIVAADAIITLASGSTFIYENVVFKSMTRSGRGFQLGTTTITPNGSIVIDGFKTATQGSPLVLGQWGQTNGTGGNAMDPSLNSGQPTITLNDYPPVANAKDSGTRNTTKVDIFGCTLGSAINISYTFSGVSTANNGVFRMYRVISPVMKNSSNSLIDGTAFIQDVDNGNRQNMSAFWTSFGESYDMTTDRSRTWICASGVTTPQNLLLSVWSLITTDSADFKVDRRDNLNSNTDTRVIRFRAFGYYEQPQTILCGGVGTMAPTASMFVDPFVTGTKAAALALSGIAYNSTTKRIALTVSHTIQELYNSIRAYLVDNNFNGVDNFATFDGTTLAISTWVVDIGTGATLSGTATQVLTSSGTTTYTGTGKATVVVSDAAGTTGVWTQSVPTGAAVAVFNQSSTLASFTSSSSGTVTAYIPAGVTGSYTADFAQYGYQPKTTSQVVTGGGYFNTTTLLLADADYVTAPASVAALSSKFSIDASGNATVIADANANEYRDYTSYWLTLAAANMVAAGAGQFLVSKVGSVASTAKNLTVNLGVAFTAGSTITQVQAAIYNSRINSLPVQLLSGQRWDVSAWIRSQLMSNATPTASPGTVTSIPSFFGTASAYKFLSGGVSSWQRIGGNPLSHNAGANTLSCYIKPEGGITTVSMSTWDGASSEFAADYNLSTLAATTAAGGGTGTVTSIGGGVYFLTLTGSCGSSGAGDWQVYASSFKAILNGDGIFGISICGWQLEPGIVASAYIPPSSSVITVSDPSIAQGGIAASGSTVKTIATITGTVEDMRAFTFASGSTFDNATANNIILKLRPSQTVPTITTTGGGTVTVYTPYTISVAGLIAGSYVQLKDLNTGTVIFTGVVSGTSFSIDTPYVGANTIRLRAMAPVTTTCYYLDEFTGVAVEAGVSFLLSPAPNVVYDANGIDGNTVTGVTWNTTSVDIDLTGLTRIGWKPLYASYCATLTTAAGIDEFANLVSAPDAATYVFDAAILFNNLSLTGVIVGGDGFGSHPDLSYMGGTGNIQFDNGKAYIAGGGMGDAMEGSITYGQAMDAMAAILLGKTSGGPGNTIFRNMSDTADKVTTVADRNGNRTTITIAP